MPRIWSEAHPMDRLSPHTWPCRRALPRPSAAALAIVAGLAAPLATPVSLARQSDAQQAQQGGPNEQQPGGQEGPAPAPPPATPPQPSGEGGLRGLWKGIRGGNQPAPTQPAQPGSGAAPPATAQPAAQPTAPATAAPVAKGKPGEFIPLPPFAEDVDLFAFAEWAAKYLDVNIFIDPALSGHTVRFTGPMQIKHEDLLDLLAFLLEEQGFGLVREREGWYSIRASGDVKVHPGDDEFATTRVIFTPLVRPSSIQAAVTGAVSRATSAGAPGAPGASKMTFVDELGAIIITDTPRTIRQVEAIVDLIVTEFAALPLHRFALTHLSADVARARIVMLTGGGGSGGVGGLVANPNQQVGAPNPLTGGGSLSSLRDRLLVDGSSNSLILRGSDQEARTVASLIEMVDTPSRLIGKRYPAGPASGTIAAIGESEGLGAVTQGQTSNRTSQFGFQQAQQFQQPQAARGGTTGASEGSRFIVEEDAFFYFGTDEQHKRVQALVDTYADQARAARVVVELYKLKHANAEDVAELLNSLLERAGQTAQTPFLPGQDQRSGRNSRTTGRDRNRAATSQDESTLERSRAAAANLTGNNADRSSSRSGNEASGTGAEGDSMSLTSTEDISIFPDVARNQLIVKAPVKQQEEIAAIITKLDVRRPQVYLEAKIVVVNATENFQFAVETQFTPGQAALFTNFGLTTAGTAVPPGQAAEARRNVATGLGGLTAAIIKSEYVPIVINALQRVGDTRILSNPQLLVNDNEEAELISVREEPFAQTVQGTSTTQTSQGGVAEAGTKLTVTPQISDAGMLNLEYAVELSTFLASTGTAGLQPPKQKENYKSVVSLPSDATMVIGGLTTENLRKSVQKVPFLGDIPIIGELFKSTTKDTTRATIYVFIRPVIVRDPNSGDLRLLTKGPMEQMKVAPDTPTLEPARIPISSGGLGGPATTPSGVRREDLELRPVRPSDRE